MDLIIGLLVVVVIGTLVLKRTKPDLYESLKEKIKLMALHQASGYIYEQLKKRININKKNFYCNFNKIGNTVSASIPLLLEKAKKANKIKGGDIIVACGFGVGLSWGIVKIVWTKKKY